MKRALDLVHEKAIRTVYTVSPAAPALEAARLLAAHNIGALVVTQGEAIVGIVSERDFVRKLATRGNAVDELAVADLMISPVLYARPTMSTEDCMAVMTENRLRHLPVVDEAGALLGLVSIGDLVKDTISEQRFVIEQLEHYIQGP